jgi:hypothetical protein
MNLVRIEMKFSSCFRLRKIINELTYFASKFNERSYSRVHDIKGPWGVSPFCRIRKATLTTSIQLKRLRESRKRQSKLYPAGFRTGYLRHVYPR